MILPRQDPYNDNIDCNDSYYYYYSGCYSAWDTWIRWVVLGIVIALFVLLCVCSSCISARRRRAMGMRPYYGTGWTQRNNNYATDPYLAQPAPPYGVRDPNGPPPYHNQQSGIELQPPSNAYQPSRDVDPIYEPPMGPPPGKKTQTTYIR